MAVYYAQNGNPTPFVHGDGERNSQRWSGGVKPRKYTERDTFYPQHIRGSGQRIFARVAGISRCSTGSSHGPEKLNSNDRG